MSLVQTTRTSDPPQVVTILCDASALDALLSELELYLDKPVPVDSVNRFAETGLLSLEELGQLARLEWDGEPTLGAGQLRILLKPSESFCQYVAALRARRIECDVSID